MTQTVDEKQAIVDELLRPVRIKLAYNSCHQFGKTELHIIEPIKILV